MAKAKRTQSSIPIYQLKVSLKDSKPLIWRQVLLSGEVKLDMLHNILQDLMGWTNSHMHQFYGSQGQVYGDKDPDFEDVDANIIEESKTRLSDVVSSEGDVLAYEYDMGDGWLHQLLVEKMSDVDARYKGYPVCLGGEGACPPEDCGGMQGFYELLEALSNPKHEEHAELKKWLGYDFDPNEFDLEDTNGLLKDYRIGKK